MRRTHISRVRAAGLIVLAVALLAGACSNSASSSNSKLEKTNLVIGAVPAEGNAGLYIAQQDGLFAKQGLHVKIVTITSSGVAIPELLHGSIDADVGQWTSFIAAEASGVVRLHALADNNALGHREHEIIVLPSSGITSPAQLKGKTIAINALNGLDTMLVSEILAEYGIRTSDVHFVAVPFPEMSAALAAHRVDAAEPLEPFVTQAEDKLGAEGLADIDQGSLLNLPLAGTVVTSQWLAKYPATAKAFATALNQGDQIATTNRAAVQRAVTQGAHIDLQTAKVMALGTYPSRVDSVQLQRVADLMLKYGQLKHPFKVTAITH